MQLRKEFKRITDHCLVSWVPPRNHADRQGLVGVRMALALGLVSRDGAIHVQYASVEKGNLADADLERCLTEQAIGSDLTLPTTYQEPMGALRSLPPLPDRTFRLWYPIAVGVPVNWADRAGKPPAR